MPRHARSYKTGLYERLQHDAEVLTYLQVALEDDEDRVGSFLRALRNVAEARSFSQLAAKSGLNRVSLYRSIVDNGNPTIQTIAALLQTLGLRLSIELGETAANNLPEDRASTVVEFAPTIRTAETSRFEITVDAEETASTVIWQDETHPMYSAEHELEAEFCA